MTRLSSYHRQNFYLVIQLSLLAAVSAKLCYLPNRGIDSPTKIIADTSLFQCPRAEDPSHLTECCSEGESDLCCPKHVNSTFIDGLNLSYELLVIISCGFITFCLLVSILLIFCCFCDSCPMYTCCICRVKHRHDEAISFSTLEETTNLNGMPDEDYNNQQAYETQIKVRPVCDV